MQVKLLNYDTTDLKVLSHSPMVRIFKFCSARYFGAENLEQGVLKTTAVTLSPE